MSKISHGRKFGRKVFVNPRIRESIKKIRRRKLTLKQKKFVIEYLKHGNATEAARIAYDGKEKFNSNLGHTILNMPKVQRALDIALKKMNLDEDFAVEALKNIIDAGSQNLSAATPANALKGIEMFLKVKGYLGNNNDKILEDSVEEVANKMTAKEIREGLEKLDEQQRKIFEIMKDGAQEVEAVEVVEGEVENANS